MGRFSTYRPTASAVVSSIMAKAVRTATRVRKRSHASSQVCTAPALGIVLLEGLAQVGEGLAAGQALGLHALHPVVLHGLELDGPALTFFPGHGVDGRACLLGRLDPVVLVPVPGGAGELGTPRPAQIVDDLAQV